jgi:adenine/guanine phosphoribosyltransferase-like PRPP-binding protein
MKPVDDVRLATGETLEKAMFMLAFSTMEVVAVGVYGGLLEVADHERGLYSRGGEGV